MNNFTNDKFRVGDIVQVLTTDGNSKYATWTSSRKVLSTNNATGFTTIPRPSDKNSSPTCHDKDSAL